MGNGRRRLIVVSNRGPVTYSSDNGERVARRGGGGLVTALRGLVAHHDVTWIASAMSDEDRSVAVGGVVGAVEGELAQRSEGVPVVLGKLWSDIGCSQGKSRTRHGILGGG